jgi:hypothetical protein
MSMLRPRLTFACELSRERLVEVFAERTLIEDLHELGARVALMLSDFSPERAAVVHDLNGAGVPVVGVPLLPPEDGYYFTADNALAAESRYEEWKAWTAEHGLSWAGVGLDIEPDIRIYRQIADNPWRLPRLLLPLLADTGRPRRARHALREAG